MAPIE